MEIQLNGRPLMTCREMADVGMAGIRRRALSRVSNVVSTYNILKHAWPSIGSLQHGDGAGELLTEMYFRNRVPRLSGVLLLTGRPR